MRWFIGRRGALHVAIVGTDYDRSSSRDYVAVAAGYTQYDLLGTRAFATLSFKQHVSEGTIGLSPQLVIGIPLYANQTLTVELDQTTYAKDTVNFVGAIIDTNRGQRMIGATWSYNTTNQPFLPTRGTLLSVQPRMSWIDAATYIVVPGDIHVPTPVFGVVGDTIHTTSRQVRGNAAHYWELSERTSVSAGVQAAWTHYEASSEILGMTEDHVTSAAITGGYSYSLWDATQMRNGDSRLELSARIGSRSIQYYDFGQSDQQQISASWVRRSSWGTLRVGAGFAW
jgi:outer membrane protein assembly factor BamA